MSLSDTAPDSVQEPAPDAAPPDGSAPPPADAPPRAEARSEGVRGEGAILKILSGVQAGVEVALPPGEYRLGSDADDDIQIIDVSLAAGHLALRVRAGASQIRAEGGPVRSGNGLSLEPGGDWQEVEPLDIVMAGMTRFAIAPASAAWTSVTAMPGAEGTNGPAAEAPAAGGRTGGLAAFARLWAGLGRGRPLTPKRVVPTAVLMIVAMAGLWLAFAGSGPPGQRAGPAAADLARVEAALRALPFAGDVALRQEVDGAIFATGYVETQAERRAVAAAVEATGAPVSLRVWVLQSMAQEIAGLAEAQGRDVTFAISRTGVVTVDGTIRDDSEAERFLALVGDSVPGVTAVRSNLRTPTRLLAEVEQLAQTSRIKPWVLFRLDRGLIEATGAVPADAAATWADFLRIYARRYAADIGLRSFVQLQGINNPLNPTRDASPATGAIVIGAAERAAGDVEIDVRRLREGEIAPRELLLNAGAGPGPAVSPAHAAGGGSAPETAAAGAGGARASAAVAGPLPQAFITAATEPAASAGAAAAVPGQVQRIGLPAGAAPQPAGIAALSVTVPREARPEPVAGTVTYATADPEGVGQQGLGEDGFGQQRLGHEGLGRDGLGTGGAGIGEAGSTAASGAGGSALSLADTTRLLLQQWRDGRLQRGANADLLMRALEQLSSRDRSGPYEQSGPSAGAAGAPSRLMRQRMHDRYLPVSALYSVPVGPCWPASRLTPQDAVTALFWLDILSVGDTLSLIQFDRLNQAMLIEVALSPRRVAGCIAAAFPGADTVDQSVYLREVERNPDFVRYVLRDIPAFSVDVAGASMAGDWRFIQTRAGAKLREGAYADGGRRLLAVGELGVMAEGAEGLMRLVYGPQLNWLLE